jgi:long-chain fatty acid transport protein
MRSCRTLLTIASGLLLFACARDARAQYRSYLVGGRAAGMGGAFTALADDGAGPFYNPAGIAFATSESISMFSSVYGFIRLAENNVLDKPLVATSLNTVPVTSSVVLTFGDPEDRTRAPEHALSASVFVPAAVDLRARLDASGATVLVAATQQSLAGGFNYAYRRGRLALGGGTYLLIETRHARFDLFGTNPSDNSNFVANNQVIDGSAYGFMGSFGVRFDVTPHAHLGAALFSPGIGTGSAQTFTALTTRPMNAQATLMIQNMTIDQELATPMRVQLGGALNRGAATLSADVAVYVPRADFYGGGAAAQRVVANGSIGAEWVWRQQFPLRLGFYTDFSPTNLKAAGNGNPDVNRYGTSASVGIATVHTETNAGVNISYGEGGVPAASGMYGHESQLYGYAFVSSIYRF